MKYLNKIKQLFKKDNTSKTIQYWSNNVYSKIISNKEIKSRINQKGIFNGAQIINELIEHNENGLAYEHLIYIIIESGVRMEKEEIIEISQLANKVGIKPPNFDSITAK